METYSAIETYEYNNLIQYVKAYFYYIQFLQQFSLD